MTASTRSPLLAPHGHRWLPSGYPHLQSRSHTQPWIQPSARLAAAGHSLSPIGQHHSARTTESVYSLATCTKRFILTTCAVATQCQHPRTVVGRNATTLGTCCRGAHLGIQSGQLRLEIVHSCTRRRGLEARCGHTLHLALQVRYISRTVRHESLGFPSRRGGLRTKTIIDTRPAGNVSRAAAVDEHTPAKPTQHHTPQAQPSVVGTFHNTWKNGGRA